MRAVVALTIKELQVLWHDRPALALLFVMPAFFILVMSTALANVFEAGSAQRPIALLIVNQDRGDLADQVCASLQHTPGVRAALVHDGRPVSLADAEQLVQGGAYPLAIVFPPEFSQHVLNGHNGAESPAAASLVIDPATNQQLVAPLRALLAGTIERTALQARLPQRVRDALTAAVQERAKGVALDPAVLDEVEAGIAARLSNGAGGVVLETTFPAGARPVRKPTATEQNVPAYTIFGVFFIALTLASSIVRERTDGTAVRLLASPVPRAALLAGKLLPYYLVNLLQIAVMLAVGVLVFQLRLGNVSALTAVALALAAAATALGMLIAAIGRTEAQVGALAVLCSIVLAALGGLLVPTFIMPASLRMVARFTPQAWALDGFHDVLLRGLGLSAVLPEVVVLLGFAAAFFAVALWRYRA